MLCLDNLKRAEWSGVEWRGMNWNRYFIPLFGYFMMERNKLLISLFGKWMEQNCNYIIKVVPFHCIHPKLGGNEKLEEWVVLDEMSFIIFHFIPFTYYKTKQ